MIKYLTAVLSTTGMQIVEQLSPSHLLAQLHGTENGQTPMNGEVSYLNDISWSLADICLSKPALQAQFDMKHLPLLCSSVIVAIIMLLKSHLKSVYGISEECVIASFRLYHSNIVAGRAPSGSLGRRQRWGTDQRTDATNGRLCGIGCLLPRSPF